MQLTTLKESFLELTTNKSMILISFLTLFSNSYFLWSWLGLGIETPCVQCAVMSTLNSLSSGSCQLRPKAPVFDFVKVEKQVLLHFILCFVIQCKGISLFLLFCWVSLDIFCRFQWTFAAFLSVLLFYVRISLDSFCGFRQTFAAF